MLSEKDILTAYNKSNDSGRGYSIGEDGHNLDEAASAEGLSVVESFGQGHERTIVARDSAGLRVVVGWANGPWAVDLAPSSDNIDECEPGIYSAWRLNPPSGKDCTHVRVLEAGRLCWCDRSGNCDLANSFSVEELCEEV